ncbi:MAG: hypothetical protein IJ228_12120 [Succinivibrio sp.]|nr:hypothetical protein [Succinivibrio sp.]
MIVIALQGLKPRVGTSSVAAALSYLLSQRLSKVLAVDCAQGTGGLDVQFGLYDKQTGQNAPTGWLNALRESQDPLSCAWRYEGECFYLPQGRLPSPAAAADTTKNADPTNTINAATDAASPKEALSLLERLRTLNFSYAVLDLGVRESALAQALAAQADLSVTVVEVDGNCFLGLQSLRLGPREVLLLNKFDPRSHVCNDLDLVIRDNAGAGNVLRALIPLDESLRESLLQLQCVARYQPIAASTREIERAMIEIMLLSGEGEEEPAPDKAPPSDSSTTAEAAASDYAASNSATPASAAAESDAAGSGTDDAPAASAASSLADQSAATSELSAQNASTLVAAPEGSRADKSGSSS